MLTSQESTKEKGKKSLLKRIFQFSDLESHSFGGALVMQGAGPGGAGALTTGTGLVQGGCFQVFVANVP